MNNSILLFNWIVIGAYDPNNCGLGLCKIYMPKKKRKKRFIIQSLVKRMRIYIYTMESNI